VSWFCAQCGKSHDGLPALAYSAPAVWAWATEEERNRDFRLTTDFCYWKGEHFFIRCALEIPYTDRPGTFDFGVWSTLSNDNMSRYVSTYGSTKQSHLGQMFGWFSNQLPDYPDTLNLKCQVSPRDDGLRPFIELERSDHPLAVQQREGISFDAAATYAHAHMKF
jgi:hypothetical protein